MPDPQSESSPRRTAVPGRTSSGLDDRHGLDRRSTSRRRAATSSRASIQPKHDGQLGGPLAGDCAVRKGLHAEAASSHLQRAPRLQPALEPTVCDEPESLLSQQRGAAVEMQARCCIRFRTPDRLARGANRCVCVGFRAAPFPVGGWFACRTTVSSVPAAVPGPAFAFFHRFFGFAFFDWALIIFDRQQPRRIGNPHFDYHLCRWPSKRL